DARFIRRFGLGMVRPAPMPRRHFIKAGYLVRARTVADLAAALGVPGGNLSKAIETNNRYARTGVDLDFGKGSSAYHRYLGDPDHGPNPCIGPIDQPPFFAVRVFPGDIGTSLGLRTDAAARVLDRHDRPIEGLYACGNDMNSVMAGTYPSGGITLGPAMTFGYLAARALAADDAGSREGEPRCAPCSFETINQTSIKEMAMTNLVRGSAFTAGEVDVSADDFFALLRDWPAVMKWAAKENPPAPLLDTTLKKGHDVNILPCTRVCHMDTSTGFPPTFEETLLHADSEGRRIYYNVEGVAAGGMRNYLATTFVDEISPKRCRVTCSSSFDVPDAEAARNVKAFLEAVYDRSVIKGIAGAVKREAAAKREPA
ncbi:MAG: hypothetical protein QOD56_2431, partial [Gammaproteobacteria bacterium]|nr:hypothetical protein [Gammaproteobacteria bacterium]